MNLSLGAVGWPMVILAAIGLWRIFADRTFGRLDWMLAGWAVAWVAFLAVGLAPVNPQFARYAVEFIARVDYATYPGGGDPRRPRGGVGLASRAARQGRRGRSPARFARSGSPCVDGLADVIPLQCSGSTPVC